MNTVKISQMKIDQVEKCFEKNYFPNFPFFKFMLLKSYCEYVSIQFSYISTRNAEIYVLGPKS